MRDTQRSEAEQAAFFESCYDRFLKARASSGEINHFYYVAGTTIRLIFAGETLVPYLTPALEHLRIPETTNFDLTLCIWDSESTSVEIPPSPCTWDSFTDRGDIWGFNSRRIKTAFHYSDYSINLMDLENRTGIYWVKKADTLPYWVISSPLRTLFHWWMEKNGCQLLHAAAVGTEEGAVLITGKGGIGKSTTALSCLQSGLYYLADDYLITQIDPEPTVYSLYSTAKLNGDQMNKFPDLSGFIHNSEDIDRDKAVLFLYPNFMEQIVSEMPLKAVLMPEISDRAETRLTPVPGITIQRSASFTTMSQLPNVGSHTHDYISRLSASLPGYTLELGRDLDRIPKAITGFLRELPEQISIDSNRNHSPIETESRPLISVIIPVYNGEKFVKEVLENVLAQNYPSFEIIIIDDGSTDRTGEIVEKFPYDIRYFRFDNNGAPYARNRGIRDASGELLAFLDVDDLWPENNLNILVDHMSVNPDFEIIHGYAQLMEYSQETDCYEYRGNPKEEFPYYIGAAVYRKTVFEKVGLFDNTLKFGEDTDWFNRAREQGLNIKRLEEVTLFVRRHGRNMTHGKNLVELNTLKVFKKHLDRTRTRAIDSKET